MQVFGDAIAAEGPTMKKSLRTIVGAIGAVICIVAMLALAACGTSASSSKGSEAASSSSAAAASSSSSSADTASSSASTDGTAKKKVYFAAPLFSQSEKDFNLKLTQVLEDHGYQVFLPQRDGYLAAELEGKTEEELTQMIFDKDTSEVMNADILFMVLDGRVPDEGACVELGMAYANGKPCYAVKTDSRSVEINMDLNPMITGCFVKIFKDFDGDKLIEQLDQYLSENEL